MGFLSVLAAAAATFTFGAFLKRSEGRRTRATPPPTHAKQMLCSSLDLTAKRIRQIIYEVGASALALTPVGILPCIYSHQYPFPSSRARILPIKLSDNHAEIIRF